jgi:hypothetical protein
MFSHDAFVMYASAGCHTRLWGVDTMQYRGLFMKKQVVFSMFIALLAADAIHWVSGVLSPAHADSVAAGSMVGQKFSGKVELNTTQLAPGENVIQIVDHDRSVICYGKFSQGGASTISCQKFK